MKNGDILWNPYTDSHEDIITLNNLRDTKEGNFCRVEFVPPYEKYDQIDTYEFKLDQPSRPSWFTSSKERSACSKLRTIVRRMLVTGHHNLLSGGSYILCEDAAIGVTQSCRIIAMLGKSLIGNARAGTFVSKMFDHSKITDLSGNAWVTDMDGKSSIDRAGDNSIIQAVGPFAHVASLFGFAHINELYGYVFDMCNDALIKHMRGKAKLHTMSGYSSVLLMSGRSRIDEMHGASTVKTMEATARVTNKSDFARVITILPKA